LIASFRGFAISGFLRPPSFSPIQSKSAWEKKITGLGLLELSSESYRFDLVCPDGLTRNNLVEQPFYNMLK
jgi:hypothetical protein